MGKKHNKKTGLSKHTQAPLSPKVDSGASELSSSVAGDTREPSPSTTEKQASLQSLPMSTEPAQDTSSQSSLLTLLEESLAPILSTQARLQKTMHEQDEYLKMKRMERWSDRIGRPWLHGENSLGKKLHFDERFDYSSLPTGIREAVDVENSLPKDRRPSYLKAWLPDISQIELILSKIVDMIAKEWKKAPESEFKDIMNVMYGLCTVLKSRLGLEHELAAEPLHNELVDRFSAKLYEMAKNGDCKGCFSDV
ncbi:hypothetical protein AMS68_003346 [Peltaster fructicola]|uniref:Uncharacterized protein n=1 Tax=Peltaster fructicola TaxID=286661 RepID=A0A6H0XT83_9PEZI|nr:hypothetical protein AMS68_003346 [Peltaster fructicola]